jgi:riboflavin synthase
LCIFVKIIKKSVFTGIVEAQAKLISKKTEGTNVDFTFELALVDELKIDQSVAHNGVCLTVVAIDLPAKTYMVTAIHETLLKTNMGSLALGNTVNIERCMPANGRFDGHIVQGHVDTKATVCDIEDLGGSWRFGFEHDAQDFAAHVKKGSITVNGCSLTVVDSWERGFSVAIIPYTYKHTNFGQLKLGDSVNLEFDILGKYIAKMMQLPKYAGPGER